MLKAKGECQHNTGFSETDSADTGFSDTGFSETGFSDTGLPIQVFQILVFQIRLFFWYSFFLFIPPNWNLECREACLPNTCLPNKCVCPPVCPTASSPKAQTFEPPLTIHFDVLFAQFFLVIKAAVLHMEFCFMTGLPQESRRFFVFANSPAQWAKCQAGNHPKSVQSLAHKRFVSQKSGTKRNWWEKIRESSA